ncbi:MAG: hypothetical protein ACRENQ_09970 [Gemmatimonadaceae bacterium]
MTRPPRLFKQVVGAFCPSGAVADDVLGDMNQEFAQRVEAHGPAAARRWYRAEATRTLPHLVVRYVTTLHMRDLLYLAGVAAVALATSTLLGSISLVPLFDWLRRSHRALAVALSPATGVLFAATAGYTAALLGRRAPFQSALALGLAWASGSLAVGLALNDVLSLAPLEPEWKLMISPAMILLGTACGGLFRVGWNATDGPPGVGIE